MSGDDAETRGYTGGTGRCDEAWGTGISTLYLVQGCQRQSQLAVGLLFYLCRTPRFYASAKTDYGMYVCTKVESELPDPAPCLSDYASPRGTSLPHF